MLSIYVPCAVIFDPIHSLYGRVGREGEASLTLIVLGAAVRCPHLALAVCLALVRSLLLRQEGLRGLSYIHHLLVRDS